MTALASSAVGDDRLIGDRILRCRVARIRRFGTDGGRRSAVSVLLGPDDFESTTACVALPLQTSTKNALAEQTRGNPRY